MATRSENEQRLKREFEHLLVSAMKADPNLTQEQAALKAQENLMENNPFMPPKNGACIINSLPIELLAHIFRVGVEMQREGGDEDDEFEPVDDEEEKKELKKELNKVKSADEEEGDTSDEEGPDDVEALPTDDNDPEWEDEESEGEHLADDEGGSDDDEDMDTDASEDEEDTDYDVPFEFLVSHVCRHWRETAINTPDLWSSIYIDQPHQWDRYEAYLERSKGQVLDLDINLEVHSGDQAFGDDLVTAENSMPDVQKVLDLIMPKADQWRSLTVEYDFWLHAREFLKQMAEVPSAPHLERLHMESYEDSTGVETFEPLQYKNPFYLPFHGNAPNLRFVKLISVHIDWDGAISMFQGLQELDLRFHTEDVLPSWRAFSSYLKNSPQLIRLELHESGPKLPDPSAIALPPLTPAVGLATAYYTAAPSFDDKEPEDPYEWPMYPLEVSSLRDLKLSHHEAPYATALLTKLHLPNLRTLYMDYEEGGDFTGLIEACSQPLRGVNSRRSVFQTIEEFELKSMGTVRSSALPGMLEALSGLKHLSLTCFDMGNGEGFAPPDSIWAMLSRNAKTVLDALKAKRANQNQSVPPTPINTPASYLPSAPPSASSFSADPVAPLTIIPPSPSAPLPATGAGIEPSATPLTAQEELDSLNVKLLLPNLEGLRTAGLKGARLRRFLLRRLKIGAPIKTLSVHHIDELSEGDEKWMEDHLETFEYYSDSDEDDMQVTDDEDLPPFEEEDDPNEDDDDDGDDGGNGDDDEWEDTDEDNQGGDDDQNDDDDDDDDDAGDDGEGGGRVQTRRGPSARATRRGAASMHVTTGLATLD